jgi:hypothetical protein
MNNDYTYLVLFGTLGIPLLLQYAQLTFRSKKIREEFWTNRNKNKIKLFPQLKKFYYFSIIMSFIVSIFLIYYLITEAPKIS